MWPHWSDAGGRCRARSRSQQRSSSSWCEECTALPQADYICEGHLPYRNHYATPFIAADDWDAIHQWREPRWQYCRLKIGLRATNYLFRTFFMTVQRERCAYHGWRSPLGRELRTRWDHFVAYYRLVDCDFDEPSPFIVHDVASVAYTVSRHALRELVTTVVRRGPLAAMVSCRYDDHVRLTNGLVEFRSFSWNMRTLPFEPGQGEAVVAHTTRTLNCASLSAHHWQLIALGLAEAVNVRASGMVSRAGRPSACVWGGQ